MVYVFLLAVKFEGALSLDQCESLYKVVFIDNALVCLVGTARMSDFPVVYGISQDNVVNTPLNVKHSVYKISGSQPSIW